MAQKPVHEIRLGRIKAALWRNDSDLGTRYNTTFTKVYRTNNGWQSTDSFGRDDLLLLAKVADLAHTWIHQQVGGDQEPAVETQRGSKAKRKAEPATNSVPF